MAMNPFKKTHQPRDGEIVASAAVDLTKAHDVNLLRTVLAQGKPRAAKAWKWYGDIGEVHYAVSRSARVAGYAQLVPRKILPNGGLGEVIKGGMEADIASMIGSPYGGVRGLIERYFTCLKVPGETYLIRCRDSQGVVEGYDFLSSDEISLQGVGEQSVLAQDGDVVLRPDQPIYRIVHPGSGSSSGTATTVEVKAEDFLGRVWRPSSRWVEVADSPMFALDTHCELLHLLTIGLRGKLLSRLALNGILFIPSEMQDIQGGANNQDARDGRSLQTRITDKLIVAATYNVTNHAHAESAVPIVMSGPAIVGEKIKWITADATVYETDMALRQELIDRILQGLDVTPTSVKGIGDASHWSAWAVEDDERRVNIQPDLETMCWALTRMILHAEMVKKGAKPGRILRTALWYDLTSANVSTNQAEDGRQALDRNVVGPGGARRMMNIPETDAPTGDEEIRWFGRKHGDPYLATFNLPEANKIDWEKVGKGTAKTGPAENSPADPPEAGPGIKTGARGKKSESDTPRAQRPAA